MNIISSYLLGTFIFIRNLLFNNYFININAIVIYHKFNISIYNCNNIYFKLFTFPLRIIPFTILLYLFKQCNIYIIYKTDSLYKINYNKVIILPVILKSSVLTTDNEELNINFKNYSPSIPIKFILNNMDINTYNHEILYIKYMSKGKIIEKRFNINILNNKLSLFELFY
jgi:hypothetical protein